MNQREQQLQQKQEELQQLDTDLRQQQTETEQMAADLQRQQEDLAERQAQLDELAEELRKREALLTQKERGYRDTLQQSKEQLASERETLRTQEQEIEQKNAELQQREAQFSEREGELQKQSDRIKRRTRQLKEADEAVRQRRKRLRRHISTLRMHMQEHDPHEARTASQSAQQEGLEKERQMLAEVKKFLESSETQMMRRWAATKAASIVVSAAIAVALIALCSFGVAYNVVSPVWQATMALNVKPVGQETSLQPQAWLDQQHQTLLSEPVLKETLNQMQARGAEPFASAAALKDHLAQHLTVAGKPGSLTLTHTTTAKQRTNPSSAPSAAPISAIASPRTAVPTGRTPPTSPTPPLASPTLLKTSACPWPA